jgi:hypothetical protein
MTRGLPDCEACAFSSSKAETSGVGLLSFPLQDFPLRWTAKQPTFLQTLLREHHLHFFWWRSSDRIACFGEGHPDWWIVTLTRQQELFFGRKKNLSARFSEGGKGGLRDEFRR